MEVTTNRAAKQMVRGPGGVSVVGGTEELALALDDHLAVVADDLCAFA